MRILSLFKKPVLISPGKQKIYDLHDREMLDIAFSREESCVQAIAREYYAKHNLSQKDVEQIRLMMVPYDQVVEKGIRYEGTFRGHQMKILLEGEVFLDGVKCTMPEVLDLFQGVITVENLKIEPVPKLQRQITYLLTQEEQMKNLHKVVFDNSDQ